MIKSQFKLPEITSHRDDLEKGPKILERIFKELQKK